MGGVRDEFRGREVAAYSVRIILETVRLQGVSVEEVLTKTRYSWEHISSPNARIAWESFRRIMQAAGQHLDAAGLEQLGSAIIARAPLRPMASVCRMFTSLEDLFRCFTIPDTRGGKWPASCYSGFLHVISESHFIAELFLDEGYRKCPEFYRMMRGALAAEPAHFGEAAAAVEMEETPGGMRYLIHCSPGGALKSWLSKTVLRPGKARRQLKDARRLSEAIYQRYRRIEAELLTLSNGQNSPLGEDRLYRQLFQNASDAIFALDLDGCFTAVNPAMEQMTGYSCDQLVGKHLSEVVAPEERELLAIFQEAAISEEQMGRFEMTLVDSRGRRFNLEVSSRRVYQDDQIVGVESIARDITQRKRSARLQNVLYQIAQATSSSRDLPELLAVIHQQLSTLISANNFFVALYDEETGNYRFPYWVDEHDDDFSPQPMPKSLTEYVRKTGRALFADEALVRELKECGEILQVGPPSNVWMGVPLKARGGVIGVVAVQDYGVGEGYSRRDLDLLSFVSDNIALAIERKQNDEALRESEARFRTMVEHAPEAIVVFDAHAGRFVSVNQNAVQLFGMPEEALLQVGPFEVSPERQPDGRLSSESAREKIEMALNGQSPVFEWVHLNAAGREVQCEIRLVRLAYFRRELLRASITDITERKLAQKALEESESRYRRLVEQSPETIAVHSEGRLVFINAAGLRLLGAGSAEEVIGRPVLEFLHSDYRDVAQQRIIRLQKEGSVPPLEEKIVRLDGRVVDVEIAGSAVFFQGKNAVQLIIRDITQRKKSEAVLRNIAEGVSGATGEAFFRKLVTYLTDTLETDYAFIGQVTGGNADKVSTIAVCHDGKIIDNFEYFLDSTPCANLLERGSCSHIGDVQEQFPDDIMLKELGIQSYLGTPLFDSANHVLGIMVVLSCRKIDNPALVESTLKIFAARASAELERKRSEEERLKLEAKIRHTQKLESLGVLAGGIAHDFNNLLTGILGNAGLALMDAPPDSTLHHCLENIEKTTLRAADLCQQMLAYSGRGKFVLQPLDVNLLIQEMVTLLKVSISKKVILDYHLSAGLPAVEGDATQIQQVMMNLITNASEAMGETSGRIIVSSYLGHFDGQPEEGEYLSNELAAGEYVFLEVRDDGVGMERTTLERIFDPFFTTKFTGRGLGLAAVLGIVQSHGGAIVIKSAPGSGTTFKVLLPGCNQPALPLPGKLQGHHAWRGSGKVMVVDDEETIRNVSTQILTNSGFEVITAADGYEAVEIFSKDPAQVDLVLLDMTMPHLDGEETLHKLRGLRQDIPIILSSGYNDQELVTRLADQKMAGFLQKPYQPAELVTKIKEILGH